MRQYTYKKENLLNSSSWKYPGKLLSRLFVEVPFEVVRVLYLKYVRGQAINLRTVTR